MHTFTHIEVKVNRKSLIIVPELTVRCKLDH